MIRRLILDHAYRAREGHIGSALSIADLVDVLYGEILRLPSLTDPERDRFVLSKGHAALALFAALRAHGWIDDEMLGTYCTDGSRLGLHPEPGVPGVDFGTGSLGHGLSMATGAALAARMQRSPRRVFALLSDAECNEGSVWEAATFAAHHRLSNLTAIIDLNGMQALGRTEEVLSMSPMAPRWRAFGWDVHEIDGHDRKAIRETLAALDFASGPPHCLIARTVSGKGVSFMENMLLWHYKSMSADEYAAAIAEIRE